MWIHLLAEMWQVLLQLAPWILLGTLIAGLVHILLPRNFVHRSFRGVGGVFKAVGLGVPLPLCSCGVIPAGIGLKKDGASNGAAVGFLISTPQTGVDSILVSASFLGWPFALFKVFSAAVTGVVGGLLVDRLVGHGEETVEADESAAASGDRRGLRAMLQHGLDIIRSIWHWLLIGIVVSAAIKVFVPESVFAQLSTWGSLPSAFAALLISLPLYVCATASVPIAAALVAGGLPAGAALVFLMAGPATNVATIGAVYRRFGKATTAIYLATIIAGSMLFAVMFDWLLTTAPIDVVHVHEHGPAWWGIASAVILLALIVWFAIDDVRRWLRRRAAAGGSGDSELRVSVQGMNCNNCVVRLEKALQATEGVDSASVTLEPGEAVVRGSIKKERIVEAIQAAGFQAE